MRLKKFSYEESSLDHNPWVLSDVELDGTNLIVGMNTAGKSRVISLIYNIAGYINNKRPQGFQGCSWNLTFEHDDQMLDYSLAFDTEGKITSEEIKINGDKVLDRVKDKTKLMSSNAVTGWINIAPPQDKLVMSVRRDEIEYPYFEQIILWASKTYRLDFDGLNSESIRAKIVDPSPAINSNEEIDDLGVAPYLYETFTAEQKKTVLSDIQKIGYDAKLLFSEAPTGVVLPLAGARVSVFNLYEPGFSHAVTQSQLSTGLVRTISLVVIINYLLFSSPNDSVLLLVDDLAEGLDYDRANRLSDLVFDRLKDTNVQLIAASNSRAMMNGVDIKHWNILQRKGNKVKSISYKNNQALFDKFSMTGLTNFDLFATDYLTNAK